MEAWVSAGALPSLVPVTLLAPRGLSWAPPFLSEARQGTVRLHRTRHLRSPEEFIWLLSARLNNPRSWERSAEFVPRGSRRCCGKGAQGGFTAS